MGEVDWTLDGDMNTARILLSELSEKVLSRPPFPPPPPNPPQKKKWSASK